MEKKWLKLIRQLQLKKYRKEKGLFIAEGAKTVYELLQSDFKVEALFYTDLFEKDYPYLIHSKNITAYQVKADELAKAGSFKTNRAAIAIAAIKNRKDLSIRNEIIWALDDVRDPGNLGTILRTADWYGFNKIICSETSADLYNPKVLPLPWDPFVVPKSIIPIFVFFLQSNRGSIPIFGAFTHGKDIHRFSFPSRAIIVLGNESRGIREELVPYIDQKIGIPKYGEAESLNVAVAAGVICDNIRRGK